MSVSRPLIDRTKVLLKAKLINTGAGFTVSAFVKAIRNFKIFFKLLEISAKKSLTVKSNVLLK